MIDCTQTKNYFAEKRRMTKTHKVNDTAYLCGINCADCPLHLAKNDLDSKMSCFDFEIGYLEKAIKVVQKWSDEHPQKTYLTELLKVFPNTQVNAYGIPKRICPFDLGLMSAKACRKDRNCAQCWNQPLLEREEVK